MPRKHPHASGGLLSEGYPHIVPAIYLGNGQPDSESVPSQNASGAALLRLMSSNLFYLKLSNLSRHWSILINVGTEIVKLVVLVILRSIHLSDDYFQLA